MVHPVGKPRAASPMSRRNLAQETGRHVSPQFNILGLALDRFRHGLGGFELRQSRYCRPLSGKAPMPLARFELGASLVLLPSIAGFEPLLRLHPAILMDAGSRASAAPASDPCGAVLLEGLTFMTVS